MTHRTWMFVSRGVFLSAVSMILIPCAHAQDAPKDPPPKKMSIDHLKKQYWTQGGEMDVVQNRLYSKANRLELGLLGGFVSSDPFLDVMQTGGVVGYYFSEFLGVRFLGWKSYASESSAATTLKDDTNVTANTNFPLWFAGSELNASLIYGKLSLLGKAILYYDFHLTGGLGMTGTETGQNFTQMVGLGQQIYINHTLSIRLDYRLMRYNEDIKDKSANRLKADGSGFESNLPSNGGTFGKITGNRDSWSNALFVGFNVLL